MNRELLQFGAALAALFALIAMLCLAFELPQRDVLDACRQHGYWASGNTRILCVIDEPTYEPLGCTIRGTEIQYRC